MLLPSGLTVTADPVAIRDTMAFEARSMTAVKLGVIASMYGCASAGTETAAQNRSGNGRIECLIIWLARLSIISMAQGPVEAPGCSRRPGQDGPRQASCYTIRS